MNPVKLYFAGGWPEYNDLGVSNRLVSYAYPRQFDLWISCTGDKPGNIIIDSGAFSAWSRDKGIRLDDYIDYAHRAIEIGNRKKKNIRIVNLDVIPGRPGKTSQLNSIIGNEKRINENKELIENAARQGHENLLIMIKEGIKPIHVFHQGEPQKWLDKMLESTNYIGISPANDMPLTSKERWMHSVFEYLYKNNIKIDTHGFAVWGVSSLMKLPWTSCDAASWILQAAWGTIIYPEGGFSSPDYSKRPFRLRISERISTLGLKDLTQSKMKILEEDGYTYEQLQDGKVRARINIRYFLELEKWLNKYKSKNQYKPKSKIFENDFNN